MWDAAPVDLKDNQTFTVTAPEDLAEPTKVLTRTANVEVFLIVRYTLTT